MNRYFLTGAQQPHTLKQKDRSLLSYRSQMQIPRSSSKKLPNHSRSLNTSLQQLSTSLHQLSISLQKPPPSPSNPQQPSHQHPPDPPLLPPLKLQKVLTKIGAHTHHQPSYIPPQQHQRTFRHRKLQQLKDCYPFQCKKRSGQQFRFQLDQIVLDCYQHGEQHGRKTVWRRYRQNIDALSFDTMRVLCKRK